MGEQIRYCECPKATPHYVNIILRRNPQTHQLIDCRARAFDQLGKKIIPARFDFTHYRHCGEIKQGITLREESEARGSVDLKIPIILFNGFVRALCVWVITRIDPK